jgi:predicted transcriptional regulator
MASRTTQRIALLSIRPQYAEAIFDGRKSVEFRRSRFAADVSVVVVYATQPVGKVIGWFEVDEIVEDTPRSLWRQFSSRGAIDRRAYLEYFRDAKRAFGITVRRAVLLAPPRLLSDLREDLRPPQSFQYLSAVDAAPVLAS